MLHATRSLAATALLATLGPPALAQTRYAAISD
jgi:hypothetical protein